MKRDPAALPVASVASTVPVSAPVPHSLPTHSPSAKARRERISLSSLFPPGSGGGKAVGLLTGAVAVLLCGACLLVGLQGLSFFVTGEWSLFGPGGLWPPAAPSGGSPDAEGETTVNDTSAEDPSTTTDQPPETEFPPETEAPSERPTDEDAEEPSDAPEDGEKPVPDGCIPIVERDESYPRQGADCVIRDHDAPLLTPTAGNPFAAEELPTVLIIHTHPYEGYGDGAAWYDPATGGLAQTSEAGGAGSVVALGAALTRQLRSLGVTVIHLRVAAEAGESAAALYDRTRRAVDYYCSLYPDIGLILDLRRSAELTDTGEILRTAGTYRGETCGQVGILVHGHRDTASEDLAVGLALRQRLWGIETSLSRPLRIKGGDGLAVETRAVPLLTLELGAAGNTYAEAERLTAPLGDAIAFVLLELSQ